MVVSVTLSFMHFAIVGQSEDLKKKSSLGPIKKKRPFNDCKMHET